MTPGFKPFTVLLSTDVCNIRSVWLDSINTSIHVSLYASSIGLALDVCLAKFIIRLAALLTEQSTPKYCNFLMVRPRVSSKPRKSRGSENLTSLSGEVLRLRLQALNLGPHYW